MAIIEVCEYEDCKHNKNDRCSLDKVTLDCDGMCEQQEWEG